MNTKAIALAITFAAIAIALTAIKIPTLFYPGGFFRFSQIPIMVAFLLFGFRIGVSVGLLTLIGQIAVFPSGNAIFIAYPMDFVSSLLMIAGMHFSKRIIGIGSKKDSILKKPVIWLTLYATIFRGSIMPLVDYLVVFHILIPLILKINPIEAYIVGLVPSFIAYNVIVTLYTIPLAYFIATRVNRSLNVQNINLI